MIPVHIYLQARHLLGMVRYPLKRTVHEWKDSIEIVPKVCQTFAI